MSGNELSRTRHLRIVFQGAIIWALCIALFETFQIVTSSSVRYIEPFDVIAINVLLFLAYFAISFTGLICLSVLIKPFLQKTKFFQGGLLFLYLTVSLFLYSFFWIAFKTRANDSFSSMHGISITLLNIIGAALVAFAIFQIMSALNSKGYFNNMQIRIFAFWFSFLGYLLLYIYFKSITNQGHLRPLYSVLLTFPFITIFVFIIFSLNKAMQVFQRFAWAWSSRKAKVTTALVAFAISLVLFILLGVASTTDFHSKQPNVLFISIDTLRADHVSFYNEIDRVTSPNIDRIAREGFVFKRAYSQSSWTLPSHASMMTGLFPSSHGADRNLKQKMSHPINPLPRSANTLAEILAKHRYVTAGIISNPYVSSAFGMNQGFEYYDDNLDLFQDIRYLSLRDYSMLFKLLKALRILNRNDYDGERRVLEVNRIALDWLADNKDKSNPFFLFLHYNEPHFIYEPPFPYNRTATGDELEYFSDIEALNRGKFSLSTAGLRDLIDLYDGEIMYLDEHLGGLFKKLEAWDVLDNTLLIITSDHGESFNEHEVWQHGNTLYEEQIRVPLIFRLPRVVPSPNIDSEHIVQLVDLMPTILSLLEIPIPTSIQGRSLLPIFKGESADQFNLAFSEIRPDIFWKAKNPRYGNGIKAVIKDEWKYISTNDQLEELYDLRNDPWEKTNLATIETDRLNSMREYMKVWTQAVTPRSGKESEKIDGGRLEQLRSLGYLR